MCGTGTGHVSVRVLHECVCGKAVCPHDCCVCALAGKACVASVCHVCGRHLCESLKAFSKALCVYVCICVYLCVSVSSSDLGSREQSGNGW